MRLGTGRVLIRLLEGSALQGNAAGRSIHRSPRVGPGSEPRILVAIGLRLRTEHQRRRLSLSQLAARTDDTLSKSRISNYEQGIRRLGLEGRRSSGAPSAMSTPPTCCVSTTAIRCPALRARLLASLQRVQARILAQGQSE